MRNSLPVIDKQKIEAYSSRPCLVHHIPGRVRFRIYRLKDDSDYATNLKQFLLAQPRINRVRINPAAASIAIDYRYTGSSLTEIVSSLVSLLKQEAITESIPREVNKKPTPKSKNWSSLTLPVFTTIVSWLSNQSRLVWLRPIALASLGTVTLPIVKRAIQSLLGIAKSILIV